MIKLRIWLVVLIAVILPIKGALAAVGMLCHTGTTQSASVVEASHAHAFAPHAEHVQHLAIGANTTQSGDLGEDGSSSTVSCTLCSAVCSAPPLPSSAGVFHASAPAGSERFPALASARPNAVVGGLERPPRTI